MIQLEGDAASLTFADPSFHDERDLGSEGREYWFECEVTLSIGTKEWTLHLEMIEPYRADMLGFFEQIAKAEGSPLRWESEYAELRFVVSVEGGRLGALRDPDLVATGLRTARGNAVPCSNPTVAGVRRATTRVRSSGTRQATEALQLSASWGEYQGVGQCCSYVNADSLFSVV
jgi:hypothetical protein